MASKLKIRVIDRGANQKIREMLAAGSDMKPVFATVGRAVRSRIQLCFSLGVDPWSNPWASLKHRKGQPLVDTGVLLSSFTYAPDAKGVTIGTNQMPRAAAHQFGAAIRGGRIPARPFMPIKKGRDVVTLPPDWSAAVTNSLRRYFAAAAKK